MNELTVQRSPSTLITISLLIAFFGFGAVTGAYLQSRHDNGTGQAIAKIHASIQQVAGVLNNHQGVIQFAAAYMQKDNPELVAEIQEQAKAKAEKDGE